MNEQISEAFVDGFMSKCAEAGLEKEARLGLLMRMASRLFPAVGRGVTRNAARIAAGKGGAATKTLLNSLSSRNRAINFRIGDNARLAHNRASRILDRGVPPHYDSNIGDFVNQYGGKNAIDFYVKNPVSETGNVLDLLRRVSNTGAGAPDSFAQAAFNRNVAESDRLSRMFTRLYNRQSDVKQKLIDDKLWRRRSGYGMDGSRFV